MEQPQPLDLSEDRRLCIVFLPVMDVAVKNPSHCRDLAGAHLEGSSVAGEALWWMRLLDSFKGRCWLGLRCSRSSASSTTSASSAG
jgi:hypothetical protein